MKKLPADLTGVLIEIDNVLKEQGIPPVGRPINAIIMFGKRFQISMPLTSTLHAGAPTELESNLSYTKQIHAWYYGRYGDQLKVDPSERAKIAVIADHDIWEVRLPKINGLFVIDAKRSLSDCKGNIYQRGGAID